MNSKVENNRVIVFDTTLRDGEQSPGATMNTREKLEIAHQLHRLGVDVIEAGFPISSDGDFEAVHRIAEEVHGATICALARTVEKDVIRAAEALKPAAKRRIHTFIGTSDVHVKKKLRMDRDQVIKNAVDAIRLAKTFTDDVEFSCEDAGRTDWDYIVEVLTAAIESGATTLNIPDTVGYCVPEQYGRCIEYIRSKTPGIENCTISVHCHNDLGLAVSNSLAGIKAGARQVECTVNGIGERAGNTSMEEVVMMLRVRNDYWGVDTGINTQEFYRTSRMISRITGVEVAVNKPVVGANAFAHESGIHQAGMLKDRNTYEVMIPEHVGWVGESMVMGKHSGRNALSKRLEALGVVGLSKEDLDRAFARFKDLCDTKKEIFDEDLLAIAEDEVLHDELAFQLISLESRSILGKQPRAVIEIRNDKGEIRRAECEHGGGQIDAIYNALNDAIDYDIELMNFHIEAVTSGKDALGRVRVNLKVEGSEVKGMGLSSDIIVASVQAYLNAINRYMNLSQMTSDVVAK